MQKMRLVGGSHSSEGRLEVHHDGRWGTVCDDEFGGDDATSICRILGYTSGVVNSGVASPGSGQIWLDEVRFLLP